ncbi:MAG: sigma-54 dependent transcriptional regulator [Acidobacteriota bacterium]|nr:sigma-54 dependent transcriptional regulator [Acidobacteriota bacterium]
MALLLLVEDEKLLRWALAEQLKRAGHSVHGAADLAAAGEHLAAHQPDVLLLDLSLPDGYGLDFYADHRAQLEDTVVIVMTAVGQVEDAVRAMKLGAFDFLNKPVDQQELIQLIDRSLSRRGQQREVEVARQSRERDLSQELVAEAPAFREVVDIAGQVAHSDVSSILILGESGSGKNVLARHIHALSARREKPFLEVSCAAIPDNLLESELLGHEKGAFTDAKATRRGTFELADGGTVVLDEIAELKFELQSKLLHVLEERRMRRVGGTREIFVDVRVIALTNRDLAAMVEDGRFRQDLFYRLNIFPLTLPPLRHRLEDIMPLAMLFLHRLQPRFERPFTGFTREAENRLLSYSWPGNVRELRNVVERAMILEREEMIGPASLILTPVGEPARPPAGAPRENGADAAGHGIVKLEDMERDLVARALRASNNNQTRAAELLGLTRDQLRYRLKKFGI